MDDSFIGRAGHQLRSFFEMKCSEVDAELDSRGGGDEPSCDDNNEEEEDTCDNSIDENNTSD